MLIPVAQLQAIKAGKINRLYRKWKTPRVKKGSLIKSAIGLLKILDIFEIKESALGDREAEEAGYVNRDELLKDLAKREGGLYEIRLRYFSEDPMLKLRNQIPSTTEEITELRNRLKRMDDRSSQGPWTRKVLMAIDRNPELRAADLAHELGVDKAWLKPQIRKLKNLGLTISLEVGYRLSPRGQAMLKVLKND